MPRIDCPYCETVSHATERRGSAVLVSSDPIVVSAAFQCDHCSNLLVARAEVSSVGGRNADYYSAALNQRGTSYWSWEPKTVGGRSYSDVPPQIAGPASEAHSCYSIGAYRAAVLMARSVIEAGAKDKGVETGSLYGKIAALAGQQVIRPLIADAAHEVRLLGNDMAHGDFATTDITADEAGEVLDLLDVFIAEVYELPGKINRRKTARNQNLN
ncbi:DUF4145 domain-containing protein [Curtobacterium sp. MCPF17_050]|uniref:DUF4145 domain-containing protein n=1 Tax=Curtobacterium sp. MCPF17_050 TaxID=2175664 RepID=UPI0015E8B9FF|nr:DUF4145 domain-containing protein [Curtobacterium sp. MCPF17_050]WIB16669.1 DUF4145 domain-containing protein [Curtobacterium sp. MCPF17_050]